MMNFKKAFLWQFSFAIIFISIVNCCNAQVTSYKKTSHGISCNLGKGTMNIYLLKDDLAEVKYTSLQKLEPKQSLVVLPVLLT